MNTCSSSSALLDAFSRQICSENSEIDCQILEEYLQNPFLDDDVRSLSLRTGLARDVLVPILANLREKGFLKSAGHRGHILDLKDRLSEKKSNELNIENEFVKVKPSPLETEKVHWSVDGFLNASSTAMVFVHEELVYVNNSFRQLFGLGETELSLKKLFKLFGFDPRDKVNQSVTSVSLVLAPGIEVQIRKSFCGEREGVLAVLSTDPLSWEMSYTHGQLQEDLFEQLKSKVVGPTEVIKGFLNRPEEKKIESARSAVEEIDQFLKSYMLTQSNFGEKDQ